jgi:ribosomal protein S18 acetylase RimI-like enzyme
MSDIPWPVGLPIEPARPEDGPEAARLLIETDPHLYRFLAGGDLGTMERLLATQWRRSDCLTSHAHARGVRESGRLVALILWYTAEQNAALPQFGPIGVEEGVPAEFQERLTAARRLASFLFPAVPAGAMYVQNLAVAREVRGRGHGRRLMAAVLAEAASRGFDACHLDVAATAPAVGFYRSLGMDVLVETRMPGLAERHGIPPHLRMIKALTARPRQGPVASAPDPEVP